MMAPNSSDEDDPANGVFAEAAKTKGSQGPRKRRRKGDAMTAVAGVEAPTKRPKAAPTTPPRPLAAAQSALRQAHAWQPDFGKRNPLQLNCNSHFV